MPNDLYDIYRQDTACAESPDGNPTSTEGLGCYAMGWRALQEQLQPALLEVLDSAAAAGVPITHVIFASTGWNNDQFNSIRAYDDWLRETKTVADAPFRPLLVGITWPSVWGRQDEGASDFRTVRASDGPPSAGVDTWHKLAQASAIADQILEEEKVAAVGEIIGHLASRDRADALGDPLRALRGKNGYAANGTPDATRRRAAESFVAGWFTNGDTVPELVPRNHDRLPERAGLLLARAPDQSVVNRRMQFLRTGQAAEADKDELTEALAGCAV